MSISNESGDYIIYYLRNCTLMIGVVMSVNCTESPLFGGPGEGLVLSSIEERRVKVYFFAKS